MTGLALAAALIVSPQAFAQSDDEGYGDGYQEGDYGRIRYADGGASILRADGQSEPRDRSGMNAPVFPGDTVRTGSDQRVEVQLASGTLVRLDRSSSVRFQSMPDPYAQYQDNAVLVLEGGAVRIQARLTDKEEFRIDTDAGSVYLLGEGDFRIENDGRGRMTVASLRGVAEVVGSGGSVLVRGGSRTSVASGYDPEDPRAYSTLASDGFDRWCDIRDASYRNAQDGAVAQSDVPYEVQPYYRELSSYGTWVVVPDYGRVWYPTGVYAGWRPYYDGYWSYGPGGYFWVSSEPWGWAPYHYGSWQWVSTYGWCWAPGRVYAGAWVSWSWGSVHFGWAPLNYWGYPCYRYGSYRYGYYDPDCWTFVNYSNAYVSNVRRYAVPVSRIGAAELKSAHVVTRAPRVAPSRLAVSADARASALRDVRNDRAAAIRTTAGNRRLSEISQDVLKRNPRSAERTVARTQDRFPRRNLTDDRGQQARPQVRGNERTTQRVAPDTRGNQRQTERVAPSRGNERTTQRVTPDTRGNQRQTERVAPSRGNERTTQRVAPDTRGNQRSVERVAPSRGNESRQSQRVAPDVRGSQRSTERVAPSRGNERSVERVAPSRGNERRVEPARPQQDARSNVREMYERMSRPRETRPDTPARVQPSQPSQQRAQAPRSQGPSQQRAQAPRAQAPQRSQPSGGSKSGGSKSGSSKGGGQQAQPRGGNGKKN